MAVQQLSALSGPRGGEPLPQRSGLGVTGLFAGIGGIEEGLRRSGHSSVELCEIDPQARAVLAERFPEVDITDDVSAYNTLPRGTGLLTAGFPCQDLSQAGKTLGLKGSRSSLIGKVFSILRGSPAPEWVLLENVPFMLRLGRGKALASVLDSFEELGYRWAYRVVDSRAFGVPQRRKRVFILASQVHDPRSVLLVDNVEEPEEEFEPGGRACGFYWTEGLRGLGWAVDAVPTLKAGSTIGIPSPPAVWCPGSGIVKPSIEDAERLQGFPSGWTKPAESVGKPSSRWRLVGNAVTVDVAEWIGDRLITPLTYSSQTDRLLSPSDKWPDAAYNIGKGRFAVDVGAYPVAVPRPSLSGFLSLDDAQPLSERATRGFLKRFEAGSLRQPPGFLDALREHLALMESQAA